MTKILFVGDMHGNFNFAFDAFEYASRNEVSYIIQLGDCAGFGYRCIAFFEVLSWLANFHRIPFYFIDGNHDNHTWLRNWTVEESGLATSTDPTFEKVTYIPRGARFTIDEVSFVGLGGAFSIDRDSRTENIDLFSTQEVISLGEAYRASEGGKVDILLTHDAPYGTDCYPPKLKGMQLPWDMQQASNNNRELIHQVAQNTQPRVIIHGHCHHRYSEYQHYGNDKKTKIIGLAHEYNVGSLYPADLDNFKKEGVI